MVQGSGSAIKPEYGCEKKIWETAWWGSTLATMQQKMSTGQMDKWTPTLHTEKPVHKLQTLYTAHIFTQTGLDPNKAFHLEPFAFNTMPDA